MTQLRDARLARALDHAPDAQALPDDSVRRAVRDAARRAVTPAAQPAWWKRWWAGDAGQRLPWNAALASVLLASLVTLLWVDRDIPDAQPQGERRQAPAAPAAVPPPEPAAGKVEPQPAAPAPVPASKSVPRPAPPAEPAPDRERLAAGTQKAEGQAAETQRERRAEPTPSPATEPAPLAKSAPAQADMARRADAVQEQAAAAAPPAAASVRPPAMAAAPPAPAPAPAPPAAAQRGAVASAPGLALPFAPDPADLRILLDGRVVATTRAQAPRLADLVGAAAALAREAEPLEGPVLARIEVLQQGLALGVLELAPPQIRWTGRDGRGLTARPDAAQLQALRDELARVTGR